MANEEHLAILKQGVKIWNAWREANPGIKPDLRKANLQDADLQRINFQGVNLRKLKPHRVNLREADLREADLREADLRESILCRAKLKCANLQWVKFQGANLRGADLQSANLHKANLQEANLQSADLQGANLHRANLQEANLHWANLHWANLHWANLHWANLQNASIGGTIFTDVDLSEVEGLETIKHQGPSHISTDTLYKSRGKIPEVFLRGCGLPDDLIRYIPSFIGAMEPIQYYSCFISYSSKDEPFAKRLHGRMQQEHLRVWFAPEDMKGGAKIYDQIEQAIQLYDRLLLVLSPNSIESNWVTTEIYNALEAEKREKRRKLFPIRLVDMDTLKAWKCLDADTGKDLAREVREFHIPDFSNWKDHDAFDAAFHRLLRDLRAAEQRP